MAFIKKFRRCSQEFYVALASSMSLALLIWKRAGLLEKVLPLFDNGPSLGNTSRMLHRLQKPHRSGSLHDTLGSA